jgi:arsenical pump membrane protein
VVSYTAVSPLPSLQAASAVCFLWHFPADHSGSVLPTTLPFGARTFLGRHIARCGGRGRPPGSSRTEEYGTRPVPSHHMWLVAALLGALAVATTALPWHDAVDTTQRVGPVLGFLAGIAVLAHLADDAGLFEVLGRAAARISGGSRRVLLLTVCAVATVTTIALSLDTTAVLLTPVVLALAQSVDTDPRPFAYATIWLANAGSLLLPISNLTNLLALDRLGGLGTAGFAVRMALPEVVAVSVVVAAILWQFRASLRGRHPMPAPYTASDRVLLLLSAACCLVIAPASLVGITPWKVTTPAAAILACGFLIRHRRFRLFEALPWRLLLLTEGLFLLVAALGRHGLDSLLRHTTDHGSLLVAVTGGALGNVANNLPSYLALERAVPAHHQQSLLALLLGSNAGPMLLMWGSLATLLWRERCAARGLRIGAAEFLRRGSVLVPVLVFSTWAALVLSSG